MTWMIGYLVIGMCFALYLPIRQARTRARLEKAEAQANVAEHLASATPAQRAAIEFGVKSVYGEFNSWQIAVVGLLWPTQIVAVIVAEVMMWRVRARRELAAESHLAITRCKACRREQAPIVDDVLENDSELKRFGWRRLWLGSGYAGWYCPYCVPKIAPVAFCPRCDNDLITNPGIECVEPDPDFPNSDTPELMAFVCPCGAASEWDFGPPLPVLLRTTTAVPPVEDSTEAP
jgi:hypothetical protein